MMLQRIIGKAMMSKARKKLAGGPQSLKTMRPTKGSGIKNGTGQAAKRKRGYITPMQNPLRSPKTGGLGRKRR